MKKFLISFGSLFIMAFVIVFFINAIDSEKDPGKTKAEVKKEAVTAPCQTSCAHSGDKTALCDPEKCKELNCDHKDGKCDPATCVSHKEEANKSCSHSPAGCKGTNHDPGK